MNEIQQTEIQDAPVVRIKRRVVGSAVIVGTAISRRKGGAEA